MGTGNDRSLNMLATALDMEERGKAFYDRAIEICTNALGVEIFKMLGRDELIHIERIRMIYRELKGNKGWTSSWSAKREAHGDLNLVFRDLAAKYRDEINATIGDLEALDIGIDFEMKSVAFYEGHLKAATDPMEKRFIERMVIEEKGHHALLLDTKFYLSNPAAWFVERERSGFDGQ